MPSDKIIIIPAFIRLTWCMPLIPDFDPVQVCDRIRTGDRGAEAELVQRFSDSVIFMLTQRTGDRSLAEDLHQDTFRVVLERLRSAKGISDPSKVSGFIHRTAKNIYIDHVRKQSRRNTHTDDDMFVHVPDPARTQLAQIIAEQRAGIVHNIIANLSVPRDRDILHRFYVVEQDKRQICAHLSLSSDMFDRVVSRARKRFKDAIEAQLGMQDYEDL